MEPIATFPRTDRAVIRYVLTDIDDTLTVGGRLPSAALGAMEALQQAGLRVIPITGRPAGWCDHIARMWPVDGLVGENGAFYFRYDHEAKRMVRRYWKPAAERAADRVRLDAIRQRVLAAVPGCAVAADQAYREADLAIDFCEDVPPLPLEAATAIREIFEEAGATAKISSIHVNGWFGDYDKLSMTRVLFREVFGEDLDAVRRQVVFCGDSPNDVPMFAFFPHAVGVANVRIFAADLASLPAWVTPSKGGFGFAEMVRVLLDR
ncbi:MAG: HAD-IIB family hydrolase [Lentisphaerae bacterium]|nr:HAD-IIB family hydrolase [Lentisphaerota bacterium]